MSTTLPNPNMAMRSRRPTMNFTKWSPRTASLVSGVALAAMAVLAAFGNFGAIKPLVTLGNATRTAEAIRSSETLFLSGIVCLIIVAVLDMLVAGAWYALFKPVNRVISATAAWARAVFAVGFMVAISQLLVAVGLLHRPDEALRAIELFTTIWVISLGVFGIHLLLIAYLAYRSGFIARIFGILLAVAGLGYLADAIGTIAVEGFTAVFGGILFVGEVAMIFWLLIRGRRLSDRTPTGGP